MNTRYIASRCFGAHVLRYCSSSSRWRRPFFPGKYFARDVYTTLLSRRPFFFRERFLRGYVTRAGQRLKPFMPSFSWCSLCLFFISLFFPSLLLELLFRGGHIAGQEYPSHMMKKKNDLKKKIIGYRLSWESTVYHVHQQLLLKRVALNSPSVHVSGFSERRPKKFSSSSCCNLIVVAER